MPLIARGNSADEVNTGHPVCVVPGVIKTLTGSPNVYIAGQPCHREGDLNEPHTHCPPVFSTAIVSFSPNVFSNGKRVARQGDTYSCGAFVQKVNQSTVHANG
jgi:uncharacterized Zn-binding protein involved in type VI secretion